MTELQNKLTEAEAAATEAGKEAEKLQSEYKQVTEALSAPSREIDAMVSLKKRQQQLPELVFDATVTARKANLAVLEIRRGIALEAHREAVRQVEERRQPLEAEIASAEQRVRELKVELGGLFSVRDSADREAATYATRIHDLEANLREYIQRASFSPESFKLDKSNVIRASVVPLGGNTSYVGPA